MPDPRAGRAILINRIARDLNVDRATAEKALPAFASYVRSTCGLFGIYEDEAFAMANDIEGKDPLAT